MRRQQIGTGFRPHYLRLLHALCGDVRAVSAIEFAMIAPIVILLYIGAVEIGNLLTIYRRTDVVVSTAADLVAQNKTTTKSDLSDVVAAATSVLNPSPSYTTAKPKLVLSSVVADANNNGKVAWSYASAGASPRGKNTNYTVPTGLTEASSSVIVAEVSYDFTPLVNLPRFFSPGSFTLKRTFYSRPRRSLTVSCSDC